MAGVRLKLVGSSRHREDENRIELLGCLAVSLGIERRVDFITNTPFRELQQLLGGATCGIHTMWDEHFGISVVEYMAAAAVPIAHNSAGPKMDIVVPACHAGLGRKEEGQEKGGEEGSEELISGKQSEPFIQKGQLESDSSGCPVGYLATTEDEYAAAMQAVFAMSSEERERMATAGRERAKRFSEENFDKSFKDVTKKLDINQSEKVEDEAGSDGGQASCGDQGAASADDGVSQDKEVVEDKRKRKAQEGADGEAAAKAGEAGEARSGKLARVAPVAEPEAPVAELEAPVAETRSGRPAPAADPAAPWSVGHPEGHPRSPFLRLHQEIAEFCRFVEASEQEKQARAEAVGRVTAVIHSIWAHCHVEVLTASHVEVFGSYATGMYLPTSDVDMVVLHSGCPDVQRALRALAMFVPVLQTHSASALLPPITPSLPSLFQMVVLHSGCPDVQRALRALAKALVGLKGSLDLHPPQAFPPSAAIPHPFARSFRWLCFIPAVRTCRGRSGFWQKHWWDPLTCIHPPTMSLSPSAAIPHPFTPFPSDGSATLGLSGRAEGAESTGEGAGGEEGGSQHEGTHVEGK
ncbi:unnamed protein product [Closterium sp. NIES-53]